MVNFLNIARYNTPRLRSAPAPPLLRLHFVPLRTGQGGLYLDFFFLLIW